ncbi:hypothetical protein SAMN02910339_01396 [Lachnospiraceae bacterium YSD2013]|nr:hypothetical protein SAMN02910339_01396 [Lachnospiraceae bacterium YSD2013]
MRKQNFVGGYYRLEPKKRLDVIVRNFDNFPGVMKEYENKMYEWIIGNRAKARQDAQGDLGVRIQSGANSVSPIENEVSERTLVEAIIKNGRLDESCRNIYERDDIIRGLNEIKLMRYEYGRVIDKLQTLRPWDRELFEKYITSPKRSVRLSQELKMTEDAVRNKMYRIKKELYSNFADSLGVYDDDSIIFLDVI